MSGARPDLVIGVGHAFRSDDRVGPCVAEALAGRGLPAVGHEGEGSALIDVWAGLRHVVIVDAARGGAPGTIRRLSLPGDDVRAVRFVHSTHDIGVAEAVAMAEGLGRLPETLEIVAVVGTDFSIGETMSADVQAAADTIIAELAARFG